VSRTRIRIAARRGELIELDFPAQPEQPTEAPANLLNALGVQQFYLGRNRSDYLVLVDSEETVRGLRPDIASLRTVDVRGVIVTAPARQRVGRFTGCLARVVGRGVLPRRLCGAKQLPPFGGMRISSSHF
jgi:predicted PhzF superfamily epimerase YddE/YHI9